MFGFYIYSYKPVTYGKDYIYPGWAEALGLGMSLASMIWIPGIHFKKILNRKKIEKNLMYENSVIHMTILI